MCELDQFTENVDFGVLKILTKIQNLIFYLYGGR